MRKTISASLLAIALSAGFAVLSQAAQAERHHHRGTPGDFEYYALILSWAPTFCEHEGDRRGYQHCDGDLSNTFILHGLWPQHKKGWPSDCYEGERPWIPRSVLNEMEPIMPSQGLIIHEYRVHGTCSGLGPEAFFDAAKTLYEKVTIPKALKDPQADIMSSPRQIEAAFMKANDWLTAPMMSVVCRSGDFYEVQICFNKDLSPRECGANQDQHHLCPLSQIDVPADPG
ncbi:ribonuclease T2 family protein [Methyloligella solikamskensis]|uniref:Ribonuclease T n=1 Tax=Methyloligella solikamskensis TaxID=1177756 RepID=A0ABW3JAC2_9HYPH